MDTEGEKMGEVERILAVLKDVQDEVRTRYKAEIIGIFGSCARGDMGPSSDVDVLVEFLDGATLFEFVGLAYFLQDKLGVSNVDVVPYDAVREELREQILSEVVHL